MKNIAATVLPLLALALTKAEPPSPYTTTYEDVFVPPPPPSSDTSSPSASYGAPPSSDFGIPSSNYGTPFSGSSASLYQQGRSIGQTTAAIFNPSSRYGTPSGSGYQDYYSEPANYEFSYTVEDAPSGNDFGHRENRQGDSAWGSYFVLLPDGRKQIVEYTADQNGYKPTIRYEDSGRGYGGSGSPGRGYGGSGGPGGYAY